MSFLNRLRPLPNREPTARVIQTRDTRLPAPPLHAPAVAPASGSERTGRFSNGLKEFLWQLDDIGHGNLLDLGPVSQATVSYFIDRGFKVYTEDVLGGWRNFLRDEEKQVGLFAAGVEGLDFSPKARAERFLSTNLRHEPNTFDAVLLWDVLDYLDREAAPLFIARVSAMVREAGAVLAVFHTRMPEQFHRYRVLDAHTLELTPAAPLVQPRHVYQNREIQDLFERFRTQKTFVGRDQLRENVFVK
jgi:hypothetical protein